MAMGATWSCSQNGALGVFEGSGMFKERLRVVLGCLRVYLRAQAMMVNFWSITLGVDVILYSPFVYLYICAFVYLCI